MSLWQELTNYYLKWIIIFWAKAGIIESLKDLWMS